MWHFPIFSERKCFLWKILYQPFNLITAHTPTNIQWDISYIVMIVFRLQPVYFYLLYKSMIVLLVLIWIASTASLYKYRLLVLISYELSRFDVNNHHLLIWFVSTGSLQKHIVATYLICLYKFRQFKWVPSAYAFLWKSIYKITQIIKCALYEALCWSFFNVYIPLRAALIMSDYPKHLFSWILTFISAEKKVSFLELWLQNNQIAISWQNQ